MSDLISESDLVAIMDDNWGLITDGLSKNDFFSAAAVCIQSRIRKDTAELRSQLVSAKGVLGQCRTYLTGMNKPAVAPATVTVSSYSPTLALIHAIDAELSLPDERGKPAQSWSDALEEGKQDWHSTLTDDQSREYEPQMNPVDDAEFGVKP